MAVRGQSRKALLVAAALLALGFGPGRVAAQVAFEGNITMCSDLGAEYVDATALVTVTANDLTYLSYTATAPVVLVVKGGDSYNVYPAAMEGTDLHAPLNGGGNVPMISHYFFCTGPDTSDPGGTGDNGQSDPSDPNGDPAGGNDGGATDDPGQSTDDPADQGGTEQDPNGDGSANGGDPSSDSGDDPAQNDGTQDDGTTDGTVDDGSSNTDPGSDNGAVDEGTNQDDGSGSDDSTSTDEGSQDDGTVDDGSTGDPRDGDDTSVSDPSGGSETRTDQGDTVTTLPITGTGSGSSTDLSTLIGLLAASIAATGIWLRRRPLRAQ